jgi:hypothetical protein
MSRELELSSLADRIAKENKAVVCAKKSGLAVRSKNGIFLEINPVACAC